MQETVAKSMDRWQKSRALLARAQNSLAGGVSSPFRAKFPVPLYFADAHGCRLVDVDGNEYIDYGLAWGPNILGYRHPKVVAAVEQASRGAHSYGQQHELEILVAEKIQSLVPCAERVAFTSSGSEAVQFMMRLARAFTGRPLILKFEGHYHGWMDTALWSYHPTRDELGVRSQSQPVSSCPGQVPEGAQSIVVRPWNDIALVEEAFDQHAGRIAGVIMEPVLCNSGCILPQDGYLAKVRRALHTAWCAAAVGRGHHRLPHRGGWRAKLLWCDAGCGDVRQGSGRRRAAQRYRWTTRDHGTAV